MYTVGWRVQRELDINRRLDRHHGSQLFRSRFGFHTVASLDDDRLPDHPRQLPSRAKVTLAPVWKEK